MKYIVTIEKDGLTEQYEECKKKRERAIEAYTDIKKIISDMQIGVDKYKEMYNLIPTFGDNYDALGRNTKVNIDAFQEETEGVLDGLKKFNSPNEKETSYFIKADELDKIDEITLENKAKAEERLEKRIAEKNSLNQNNNTNTQQTTNQTNNYFQNIGYAANFNNVLGSMKGSTKKGLNNIFSSFAKK